MAEIISYTAGRQLWQLCLAIIFFHSSEYVLAISVHGRSNVTRTDLLISRKYLLAVACSLLEYLIEIHYIPWLKEWRWISNLGLVMVVSGELMQKTAIKRAGRAFTHLIKTRKDKYHKMVTHGVYGFVRHPGYCGFYIWSVGTQVMLCNPLSTVACTVVVWKFFARRVSYEQSYLREFFGSEYDEYARRVPSGIPFIK